MHMDVFNQLKNILFLDIETVSCAPDYESLDDRLKPLWLKKADFLRNEEGLTPEELFFKKAGIYSEFGKIITIGIGYFTQTESGELGFRVKSLSSDDEKDVLLDFKNLMENKLDQNKISLCAHNGKEFDFPYLCRRLLINQMEIPEILNLSGKKPWEVRHLDTIEMWKFGDRKNYTSLDLLAAIFNISSSKKDIDGTMVNHVYFVEKDLKKIADYCRNDVVVTSQIYLKLKHFLELNPDNITWL